MSKNAKVWTALVTVYIIWGSTYLGIAYAGETIPPLFAASTRFITAGTLMTLLVAASSPDYAPQARYVVVGATGATADFSLVPGGVIEGIVRDEKTRD